MPKKETPPADDMPLELLPKLSIYEALPLITADVRAVGKNNKNKDQGYAFRGIDDVVQMIHELLPKYGVGIIPKVTKVTQEIVTSARGSKGWHTVVEMEYLMTARDGTKEIGSGVGESTSYDDKGIAKCQAMSLKYFLTHAFTIPTNEMLDTEADHDGDIPIVPDDLPEIPGATSAHTPAPRPAAEGRSGPRPPRADKAGQGLAGSDIAGLRRVSPAPVHPMNHAPEPTSDNDGASGETPLDQWQLEDLRAVPSVSGKPLGEASEKQLQQIVSMGEQYVAHGTKLGKAEAATRALEAAKLLLKAMKPAEEPDDIP